MKASGLITLCTVALLVLALCGCGESDSRKMEDVREDDAAYYRDRWYRKQREAAEAADAENYREEIGSGRIPASELPSEGGSSPGMTEADEKAEADREMPGEYK